MANKIFVSYKYADCNVFQDFKLGTISEIGFVTPRSYLNELSNVLSECAIQKWEKDGEDLSSFQDSTIESKLRDKIYDSSLTIVLLSCGMREPFEPQRDQWSPWEISYSLQERSRNGRISHSNAMMAVVLPDVNNSYSYCIEAKKCGVKSLKFSSKFCFDIIGNNFFNIKNPNKRYCSQCNEYHWYGGENHYFVYAKWEDFIINPKKYIKQAYDNQINIGNYNITKTI